MLLLLLLSEDASGFGGALSSAGAVSPSEDILTTAKDGLSTNRVVNDDDRDIDVVKAEDPCSRAAIRRNRKEIIMKWEMI